MDSAGSSAPDPTRLKSRYGWPGLISGGSGEKSASRLIQDRSNDCQVVVGLRSLFPCCLSAECHSQLLWASCDWG